jgi:hypothetical protein
MLTRWRKQLGKDEVDLASRIDSVTRGSGGGQRVQDGAARIGCLLLEEPRRRGNPFVEESGVRSPPARALLITPSAPGQARSARSRAANGAVSGRRSRSDSGTHTHIEETTRSVRVSGRHRSGTCHDFGLVCDTKQVIRDETWPHESHCRSDSHAKPVTRAKKPACDERDRSEQATDRRDSQRHAMRASLRASNSMKGPAR